MDKTIYNALVKYFKTLFHNGNYALSDLKKLIVLLFLYDYTKKACDGFATSNNLINSLFQCLTDSCFINIEYKIQNNVLGCK